MLTLIGILILVCYIKFAFFIFKVLGSVLGFLLGIFGYIFLGILGFVGLAIIGASGILIPILAIVGLVYFCKKCTE